MKPLDNVLLTSAPPTGASYNDTKILLECLTSMIGKRRKQVICKFEVKLIAFQYLFLVSFLDFAAQTFGFHQTPVNSKYPPTVECDSVHTRGPQKIHTGAYTLMGFGVGVGVGVTVA